MQDFVENNYDYSTYPCLFFEKNMRMNGRYADSIL